MFVAAGSVSELKILQRTACCSPSNKAPVSCSQCSLREWGREDVLSASQLLKEVSPSLMPIPSEYHSELPNYRPYPKHPIRMHFFSLCWNCSLCCEEGFQSRSLHCLLYVAFQQLLPAQTYEAEPPLCTQSTVWPGLELLQLHKVQEMKSEAKSTSHIVMHTIAC